MGCGLWVLGLGLGFGLDAMAASLIRHVAERRGSGSGSWEERRLLQEAAIFVFWPAPASSIPTDTSSILDGGCRRQQDARSTKDAGRGRATHTHTHTQRRGCEVQKACGKSPLNDLWRQNAATPEPAAATNKEPPQGGRGTQDAGRGSNWGAVVRTRLENSTLCSRQN